MSIVLRNVLFLVLFNLINKKKTVTIFIKQKLGGGERASYVTVLAAKYDNLSLIPETTYQESKCVILLNSM